jgi:hypothetical protein
MKKLFIGVVTACVVFQVLVNLSLFTRLITFDMVKHQEKDVLAASSSATMTEKFIPLGTGTINSNQWTNVPGLQVQIDPSMYKTLSQVLFEVGIFNPNSSGTISVQLYNVTTNSPVWSSTVSLSGGASGYVVSGPVSLTPGANVYQVQMVNTLNAPATLTQARLRMISK